MEKTRKEAYQIFKSYKKYILTASLKRRPTYRAKLFAALEKLNKQYGVGWVPMQTLIDQIKVDAETNSERLGPRAAVCIQREIKKAEANGFVEISDFSDSSRVTEATQDLFSFFRQRVIDDQSENQELVLRDLLSQALQGGPDKPWTKAQYERLLVFLHEHREMDKDVPITPVGSFYIAINASSPECPATTPRRQLSSSCTFIGAYPTPESVSKQRQSIQIDANTQLSPSLSPHHSFIDADASDNESMVDMHPDSETVPLAQPRLQAEYDRMKLDLEESCALAVQQADKITQLEKDLKDIRMQKDKVDAGMARLEELEIEHSLCMERILELEEEVSHYRSLIEFHASALMTGLQKQGPRLRMST